MKKGETSSVRDDAVFVRRVVLVVLIGAVAAATWLLSDILLLVFGSVLIATLLRVFATPLSKRFGLSDTWALALAGLAILTGLAAAALLLGPVLLREMRGLFEFLPTALSQISQDLRVESLADVLSASGSVSSLGDLASRLFAWSTTAAGAMASLVLVVFGGIYFAADPLTYRRGLIKLVPPPLHPNAEAALDDAGKALSLWIRGQLLAMVLIGIMTSLGLWFVGVRSAFALGFIAGIAEFVPLIGSILAAIPIALVAGAQGWETLLWALAVVIIVQQIESNLVMPLIAGKLITIAPAFGLFATVGMGVLFGPLGLLFGFPLAVVFSAIVRRLYMRDMLGERITTVGSSGSKPSG